MAHLDCEPIPETGVVPQWRASADELFDRFVELSVFPVSCWFASALNCALSADVSVEGRL